MLAALIEHRARVVSKHELLALAWPGLVVEENNLTVQVSALRKALGGGAGDRHRSGAGVPLHAAAAGRSGGWPLCRHHSPSTVAAGLKRRTPTQCNATCWRRTRQVKQPSPASKSAQDPASGTALTL